MLFLFFRLSDVALTLYQPVPYSFISNLCSFSKSLILVSFSNISPLYTISIFIIFPFSILAVASILAMLFSYLASIFG